MNEKTDVDRLGSSHCSTASEVTIESIKAAAKRCRELMPDDIPEVYIMTTGCYELISAEMIRENVIANGEPVSRYIGIPFEHYRTLAEVHRRCMELFQQGRKFAFISQ